MGRRVDGSVLQSKRRHSLTFAQENSQNREAGASERERVAGGDGGRGGAWAVCPSPPDSAGPAQIGRLRILDIPREKDILRFQNVNK